MDTKTTNVALAFVFALLAPMGARAERVGLGPIELPHGERERAQVYADAVRAGLAAAPGVEVAALDAGECAADEGRCLASAAKSSHASVDRFAAARVQATPSGYRFRLFKFAASGASEAERAGEVKGSPRDLSLALGRAAGELFGAAADRAVDQAAVRAGDRAAVRAGDRAAARAAPPIAANADAPAEARARSVQAAALAPAVEPPLSPLDARRQTAARTLLAAGLGLLTASAGLGVYAVVQSNGSGVPAHAGALVSSSAASSSGGRTAAIVAGGLAATGAGAIACGGVLFAITPGGAGVGAKF